ncbi:unnamed protein product [Cylicocyclus nassatus]|uniref:Uncharacterized protein n=1 Tax=Cylicocyclus nassatus TaxID=53992 RepID=A0AA36DPK3_CYLNA|nr:unnamed protein product [Cylicocyclus nassatus]
MKARFSVHKVSMEFSKIAILSGLWMVALTFTWAMYNSNSMFTFSSVHKLQRAEDPCSGDIIEKIQNADYEVAPFNESKVAPKYRLAVCQIEKVMTTVMDAIFCYLTNTTEFMLNNRTISTETFAERIG